MNPVSLLPPLHDGVRVCLGEDSCSSWYGEYPILHRVSTTGGETETTEHRHSPISKSHLPLPRCTCVLTLKRFFQAMEVVTTLTTSGKMGLVGASIAFKLVQSHPSISRISGTNIEFPGANNRGTWKTTCKSFLEIRSQKQLIHKISCSVLSR